MNIQELQLIVTAVTQLGAEAKGAFIWYLIADNLPGFILALVALSLVWVAIDKIIRLNQAIDLINNLAVSLGTPYVTHYSSRWADMSQMATLLTKLVAKHKEDRRDS